jgi:hypothetical protein
MNLMLADASARERNAAIKAVRERIKEIGPGELMPAFDTLTKQRSPK